MCLDILGTRRASCPDGDRRPSLGCPGVICCSQYRFMCCCVFFILMCVKLVGLGIFEVLVGEEVCCLYWFVFLFAFVFIRKCFFCTVGVLFGLLIEAKVGVWQFFSFLMLGMGVLLPGLKTFNVGKFWRFYTALYFYLYLFLSVIVFCAILWAAVCSK